MIPPKAAGDIVAEFDNALAPVPRAILGYGVMSTSGVVLDGKVIHAGGIPGRCHYRAMAP